MSITNRSYITDLDELWRFGDRWRLRELAEDDPDEDPHDGSISTEASDRLYEALNFGRDKIDAFLRHRYVITNTRGLVDSVDATSPGHEVKVRNVQWAEFYLARTRLPLDDQLRVEKMLVSALKDLQKAGSEEILGGDATRASSALPTGSGKDRPRGLSEGDDVFDTIDGAPWNTPDITG